MKRRRIFTAVVLLVYIIGCIAVMPAFASDNEKTSVSEDFCINMGLFQKDKYSPDTIVKRGEFTEVLAKVCGLETVTVEKDKWTEYVYTDDSEGDKIKIFDDVDGSYLYYSSIKAVVDAGYMKGISGNMFGPEINITATQIYKVFLDMIGYVNFVEKDGGYDSLASKLGINKGVSANSKGYVTYSDLANIIYNMLEVSSVETKISGDAVTMEKSTDDNFMNHVMGIKKVKGYLTDNGYASINGTSNNSKNEITVGDVVADIGDNEYARAYIGRTVTMYYRYDDDDNEAVYIIDMQKDEIHTFSPEDFESYDGIAIQYTNKNGRLKTVNLSNVQHMIYNDKYMGEFTEDSFRFFDGSITVIPKTLGNRTLIVVSSVEYTCVTLVDVNKEIIYANGTIKSLDLTEYDKVSIKSANGEEKGISDISTGNVLEIIRNADSISIVICTETEQSFSVKGIKTTSNDRPVIYDSSKEYTITRQYLAYEDYMECQLGKTYILYLNTKNEVVWAEAKSTGYEVGFLIGSSGNDEESMSIRISNMSGVIVKYECAESLKISDSQDMVHKKLTNEIFYDILHGVHEIIRYKLNEDGKVTYIELPMTEMPKSDDRLYKIVDADDTTKWGGTRYPYQYGGVGFGGILGISSNIQVLKVPADYSDLSKYKKTTLQADFTGNNNTRRFIAYNTKRNNYVIEYLVAKTKQDESEELKDTRAFMVVKSMTTILDSDDEVSQEIKGTMVYGSKSDIAVAETTMYCKETDKSIITEMTDLYKSKTGNTVNTYELQPGDIIRIGYDEDHYFTKAELVFRPTMTNPAFPDGMKGALAGSIGYYDSGNEYSNPMVLNENGVAQKGTSRYIVGVDFRMALSFLNSYSGGVYQVTTQDLTVSKFDPYGENGKYMVDAITMSPTSLIAVTYKDGKIVEVKKAESSDYHSYENSGNKCSRILHNWYWGTGIHGFVINYQ